MSVGNKRTLSIVVYYTLAALTAIMGGFFIYALIVSDLAMWAKIIYFIWTALVFGVVLFDIICTNNRDSKTLTGWAVYVLSILAVAMTIILYCINSGFAHLGTNLLFFVSSVSVVSIMTTLYLIATWCVGEKLIEKSTQNGEIERTKA